MTMLIKIEEDIQNLDKKEFNELRDWFENFDSKKWDEQIENDANSGKLDNLADSALADFRSGKYKSI